MNTIMKLFMNDEDINVLYLSKVYNRSIYNILDCIRTTMMRVGILDSKTGYLTPEYRSVIRVQIAKMLADDHKNLSRGQEGVNFLEWMNEDTVAEILLKTQPSDLLNFCTTSTTVNKVCKDSVFRKRYTTKWEYSNLLNIWRSWDPDGKDKYEFKKGGWYSYNFTVSNKKQSALFHFTNGGGIDIEMYISDDSIPFRKYRGEDGLGVMDSYVCIIARIKEVERLEPMEASLRIESYSRDFYEDDIQSDILLRDAKVDEWAMQMLTSRGLYTQWADMTGDQICIDMAKMALGFYVQNHMG